MNGEVLSDAEKQTVKEKLSARIRELTSMSSIVCYFVLMLTFTDGVENNLHDSD